MPERWRPVVGYEGLYEVSDQGRIATMRRMGCSGGIKARRVNHRGYLSVVLSRNRVATTFDVHRLVAVAFLGPRPHGQEVRHLNGDKTDARLSNLVYGTRSENNYDKVRHGADHQARKSHCPSGHPYDEANTYVIPSRPTARYCRTCQRAHQAAYRARQRSA